ncbi:MAG: hypothetical protein HY615_13860 [Candidatus Rokubacteria bacterium]|nr:hypothetical protein [Candidatus Rokubacteria bacterium]
MTTLVLAGASIAAALASVPWGYHRFACPLCRAMRRYQRADRLRAASALAVASSRRSPR